MNLFNISAGAALVFALAWWFWGGGSFPTIWPDWRAVPPVIWGMLPLLLALLLTALAKLGVLQRLFGTALSDFRRGQSLHSDLAKVEARLAHVGEAPSFGPAHYLTRVDHWLSHWGGKLWSGEGLIKCWSVALIYPPILLLALWTFTGVGYLGQSEVLPTDLALWKRTAVFALVLVGSGTAWLMTSLFLAEQLTFLKPQWPWLKSALQLSASRIAAMNRPALIGFGAAILLASVGAFIDAVIGKANGANVAFAVCIASLFALLGAPILSLSLLPAIVSIPVTDAIARGVLAAVAIPIVFATLLRIRRPTHQLALGLGLALLTSWALPALPSWGVSTDSSALALYRSPFCLLFFTCIAPILNGLSDWVSVNITRFLLARYRHSSRHGGLSGWGFHALDLGSALLLTLLLYGLVLALLWLMGQWGWPIKLQDIVAELQRDPWAGTSQWLLFMAVTNLIPTLVHIGLWLTGAVSSKDATLLRNLGEAVAKVKLSKESNAVIHKDDHVVSQGAALLFVYVLKIQPWLERYTVLSLVIFAVTLMALAVPGAAGLLLPYL